MFPYAVSEAELNEQRKNTLRAVHQHFHDDVFFSDKVEELNIDLDTRTVYVKSAMSGAELLEIIQKTGKTSTYVGVKN